MTAAARGEAQKERTTTATKREEGDKWATPCRRATTRRGRKEEEKKGTLDGREAAERKKILGLFFIVWRRCVGGARDASADRWMTEGGILFFSFLLERGLDR